MPDKYERAAELIMQSKATVILTGAGISTESGIPDFRSPGSGLWEKMDPMEALSADVLYNDPEKFYNTGFKIILSMKDAVPNKAHYLITEMEEMGLVELVITQNIDNLHFKAGTRNVYEVHGNTRTCSCDNCGGKYDIDEIEKRVSGGEIPPRCKCGGTVRPDVVLFGDMLPPCFYDGMREVENADLLIVIGSSLSVSPVNYLAGACKKLMIINLGDTFYDQRSELIINEKISDALGKITAIIKAGTGGRNGKL